MKKFIRFGFFKSFSFSSISSKKFNEFVEKFQNIKEANSIDPEKKHSISQFLLNEVIESSLPLNEVKQAVQVTLNFDLFPSNQIISKLQFQISEISDFSPEECIELLNCYQKMSEIKGVNHKFGNEIFTICEKTSAKDFSTNQIFELMKVICKIDFSLKEPHFDNPHLFAILNEKLKPRIQVMDMSDLIKTTEILSLAKKRYMTETLNEVKNRFLELNEELSIASVVEFLYNLKEGGRKFFNEIEKETFKDFFFNELNHYVKECNADSLYKAVDVAEFAFGNSDSFSEFIDVLGYCEGFSLKIFDILMRKNFDIYRMRLLLNNALKGNIGIAEEDPLRYILLKDFLNYTNNEVDLKAENKLRYLEKNDFLAYLRLFVDSNWKYPKKRELLQNKIKENLNSTRDSSSPSIVMMKMILSLRIRPLILVWKNYFGENPILLQPQSIMNLFDFAEKNAKDLNECFWVTLYEIVKANPIKNFPFEDLIKRVNRSQPFLNSILSNSLSQTSFWRLIKLTAPAKEIGDNFLSLYRVCYLGELMNEGLAGVDIVTETFKKEFLETKTNCLYLQSSLISLHILKFLFEKNQFLPQDFHVFVKNIDEKLNKDYLILRIIDFSEIPDKDQKIQIENYIQENKQRIENEQYTEFLLERILSFKVSYWQKDSPIFILKIKNHLANLSRERKASYKLIPNLFLKIHESAFESDVMNLILEEFVKNYDIIKVYLRKEELISILERVSQVQNYGTLHKLILKDIDTNTFALFSLSNSIPTRILFELTKQSIYLPGFLKEMENYLEYHGTDLVESRDNILSSFFKLGYEMKEVQASKTNYQFARSQYFRDKWSIIKTLLISNQRDEASVLNELLTHSKTSLGKFDLKSPQFLYEFYFVLHIILKGNATNAFLSFIQSSTGYSAEELSLLAKKVITEANEQNFSKVSKKIMAKLPGTKIECNQIVGGVIIDAYIPQKDILIAFRKRNNSITHFNSDKIAHDGNLLLKMRLFKELGKKITYFNTY